MDARDFRILDLVDHPVFVLAPNPSGVPVYVAYNDHACRKLCRPREAFLGRSARECFPGDFGDVAYAHHLKAFTSGVARSYEVLLPHHDGARLIRTVLEPVLDDDGQVTHVVGSSTRISRRTVVKPDAPAQPRDADAETFVAIAAHELRSPLRNIGTIVEMLRDDYRSPTDSACELFEHFDRLYSALSGHIEDILAHSNILETPEESVEFRLEAVLEDIMLVHDPLGLCNVAVTEARILGDRSGVQIVLGSLIDNAIKHAQPAGGVLCLDISAFQDSQGLVSITLSDNGLGFNEPALLLLDGGKLRPGSGFGLFGIRRLIHSRNGRMSVTRAADRSGASVTFSLKGQIIAGAGYDTASVRA